jgi:hypothetical protein
MFIHDHSFGTPLNRAYPASRMTVRPKNLHRQDGVGPSQPLAQNFVIGVGSTIAVPKARFLVAATVRSPRVLWHMGLRQDNKGLPLQASGVVPWLTLPLPFRAQAFSHG